MISCEYSNIADGNKDRHLTKQKLSKMIEGTNQVFGSAINDSNVGV